MKYKLKDLVFEELVFKKSELENGTILNLKYKESSLEFQTPKVVIESLIKENDHEYLVLKIMGTQACKTFCSKIAELEKYFNEKMHFGVKSVFNEDRFVVKIPFKYSKPLIKVYKDNSLFNYYHLSKDLEVICLLGIDKIWINNYNEHSFNLTVKEIMVI